MAVAVRLSSRGMPARAAAAAFTLASTPMRATGGLSQRITAVYGTVPVATPGPSNVMAVPPGPTNGHTAAIPNMFPTWSIIKASLPRVLPWAGGIPHGIPGVTYTAAIAQPAQDAVVKPAVRVRTGGNRGRVTTEPKPTFKWVRQGG
jgi:hypothetical protein